ncbi:lipid II flippase MurJ [Streptomyces sp. 8K308]|uniref:murein biosynthesis integral membrane protein MurJ n=1 Tax=Streptomyces sp. 8K308 TaxID=2530388 RepID=UPI001FB677A5|nr:lipid II flippase MurJ [Streptomyces sp. 8K308]
MSERFVARAAGLTAALTVAGALCGLLRDQIIATLYGAGGATDAFLVAWTLPEFAATLLIEEAMALVLVPAFSLALANGGRRSPRALVAATLPRLLLVLAAASAALAAGAPLLVGLLAPGLADPDLAVDCTRLTAVTILTFGLAGYLSAALRAHRDFLPPAAIYVAYNVGIVTTALLLHTAWGIRAAATGVALGGLLMVLLQLPFFLHRLRLPAPGQKAGGTAAPASFDCAAAEVVPSAELARRDGSRVPGDSAAGPAADWPARPPAPPGRLRRPAAGRSAAAGRAVGASRRASVAPTGGTFEALRPPGRLVVPVVLFALSRQAQVLVERFLASSLPSGAISWLNYAQKVAQLPMVLAMMICTVTLPMVAGAVARGDLAAARLRVERDLVAAAVVVLLGAAYVVAYAPRIIELLFQRGAFDAQDTAATAAVMRVYAVGLLGHTLVGALVRPFFSAARPAWFPFAAMAAGLLVTVVGGLAATPHWGAAGIAAANAAGITVTASLLLRGLAARTIPVDPRRVLGRVGRLTLSAAAATAAGWSAADAAPTLPTPATLAVGALILPAVFAIAAHALRVPEARELLTRLPRPTRLPSALTRRHLTHGP